ncbi:MAG: CRISPR system precrRNA processing endoribonuclease RAMP protein Cas6 [Syntrophotalea acetylenica]|nr:CRISPR system precrRNA processing endoribonuclease RAMP protein Cas6 [Syntrophotalea acetylenica]
MRFGSYHFTGIFQETAELPPYKGSTFRGSFGQALRKTMCVTRQKECVGCLLARQCLYATTFENPRQPSLGTDRPRSSPPLPYVIEPDSTPRTQFRQHEKFEFDLLLFGKSNDYLPYFVFAVEQMGNQGIGRRKQEARGRFRLQEVKAREGVVYRQENGQLLPGPHDTPLVLTLPEHASSGALTLRLITPLRLKHANHYQAELPFHLLVRAMLRRISTLFETFGEGEPVLDYRGIIRQAETVAVTSEDLHWHDWTRYSNRQEQKMLLGGMLGQITYHGKIGTYLPLLEIARQVHIGKQTSFGLGHIDYAWRPDA